MFSLFTKTFGGKIWANFQKVSPEQFFEKLFKAVTPQKFLAEKILKGSHLIITAQRNTLPRI